MHGFDLIIIPRRGCLVISDVDNDNEDKRVVIMVELQDDYGRVGVVFVAAHVATR